MYNLSPRWKKIKSSTSENVGPNYYYVESNINPKNRYGFLSTTPQSSTLGQVLYTQAVYNTDKPRKIIGGSSLKNKAKREFIVPKGIGPAHYDVKYIDKKSPSDRPKPLKGRKLYVCPVIYNTEAYGPSIPTKIDENGYDYDEYNRLIKMPADSHDDTLGPAYYNVSQIPCLTSWMYSGCKWSKRTSERKTIYETLGPGPAIYNISKEKPFNERDELFREMARRLSFVPRFLDMQERRLKREDMPGPAEYNIDLSKNKKSLSFNPPGFASRTVRFPEDKSSGPGPKYNVRTEYLIKEDTTRDATFNSKSERFKTATSTTPAPGQYDIITSIDMKLRRNLEKQGPPFNNAAERDMSFISKHAISTPSPLVYEVEKFEMEKGFCDSSVFRSVKERFPEQKRMKSAEPATYDVCEAFRKLKEKTSHYNGKVPFLTNHPRRQTFKPFDHYTPSSADYEKPKLTVKSYYFKTTPRFEEPEDTPGPGSYKIHPSCDISMYKAFGTHNLKLKENVLHTKLRKSPAQTRMAFKKELKKNKKLCAFYKPPAKISSWLTLE